MNNFWLYILENHCVVQRHLAINIIFAAFMGKNATDNGATTLYKRASMEHQQFSHCIIENAESFAATVTHI
jgi:hypothetical protein